MTPGMSFRCLASCWEAVQLHLSGALALHDALVPCMSACFPINLHSWATPENTAQVVPIHVPCSYEYPATDYTQHVGDCRVTKEYIYYTRESSADGFTAVCRRQFHSQQPRELHWHACLHSVLNSCRFCSYKP